MKFNVEINHSGTPTTLPKHTPGRRILTEIEMEELWKRIDKKRLDKA
jgi:hypothetical protein